MKKFLGLSWIGWLNVLIIQWFFIRICYVLGDDGKPKSIGFLGMVIPLTGWYSDFAYVNLWQRSKK